MNAHYTPLITETYKMDEDTQEREILTDRSLPTYGAVIDPVRLKNARFLTSCPYLCCRILLCPVVATLVDYSFN